MQKARRSTTESRPYMKNIYVENIEDEDELTSETPTSSRHALPCAHRVQRHVAVENAVRQHAGKLGGLSGAMFADATTFSYNANMRGLVVDKLSGLEVGRVQPFHEGHGQNGVPQDCARHQPPSGHRPGTRTATSNTTRSKIRCRLTSTRRS